MLKDAVNEGNKKLIEIVKQIKFLLSENITKDSIEQFYMLEETYQNELNSQQIKQKKIYKNQLKENESDKYFSPLSYESEKKFDKLKKIFIQKKMNFNENLKQIEKKNITGKLEILKKLESLIKNEENIKVSFEKMAEFSEDWKRLEPIPNNKQNEIQSKYNSLKDKFYYNINIYRELLQHDFKRNLQLKENIIEKLKNLKTIDNIKEFESLLKKYTHEWDEIGPVHKENWEEIKIIYSTLVKNYYTKLKNYYTEKREKQKTFIESKKALIEKIKTLNKIEIHKENDYKKLTKDIFTIKDEWRSIGYISKDINDKLWEEIKVELNLFFSKKHDFFEKLKSEHQINKKRKKEIINEIKEIPNDLTWEEKKNLIIKAQKKWKTIGQCSFWDEKKLWITFKETCNLFFDEQKKYFKDLKNKEELNLTKKIEFIEQIKNLPLKDSNEENLKAIDFILEQFKNIGPIPKFKIHSITKNLDTVLEKKYLQIGISKKETQKKQFLQKIKAFESDENSDEIKKNEIKKLNKFIEQLKSENLQFENNLSFFKYSKGENADKLKQNTLNKIEENNSKIKDSIDKIKILRKI